MIRRLTYVALCAMLLPVVADAQSSALPPAPALERSALEATVPVPDVVPEAFTPVAGPATASLSVAGAAALREVQAERAARNTPPQMAGGKAFGKPEALMILGGAALLGGSLVGGTSGRIISVTGLVVGLYGLYLFLQ
jgi:hypothetical protein